MEISKKRSREQENDEGIGTDAFINASRKRVKQDDNASRKSDAPDAITKSPALPNKSRQTATRKQDPKAINQVWVHGGCPDGMGAATVAYLYLQSIAADDGLVEFKYLFHGSVMPSGKDKHVAIFDFCPKKEELQTLLQECKSIGIYDHHESAFALMDEFPEICTYDNDHSGVGLAWSFFFPEQETPPLWVSYIEDRDLWRFKFGEKTKQFAAFMYYNGHDMTPESWFYELYKETLQDNDYNINSFILECEKYEYTWCLDDEVELLAAGKSFLKVQDAIVARRSKYVKKAMFCGIPCAVINDSDFVSEICNAILEKHKDIKLVLLWRMDHINDSYRFSVRSREKDEEISCGELCSKFGGGGHKQAAGFKLPGIDTHLIEFLAKHA